MFRFFIVFGLLILVSRISVTLHPPTVNCLRLVLESGSVPTQSSDRPCKLAAQQVCSSFASSIRVKEPTSGSSLMHPLDFQDDWQASEPVPVDIFYKVPGALQFTSSQGNQMIEI